MSNSERDCYEVPRNPRGADAKTIKDAYQRLAVQWHPDRNKTPDAEERFKEIAKAYAILSDPKQRAKYDARGFEGISHYSHNDLFRDVDLGSIFGDLGFVFDRVSIATIEHAVTYVIKSGPVIINLGKTRCRYMGEGPHKKEKPQADFLINRFC